MQVQLCLFSNLPEGLTLPRGSAHQVALPSHWSKFAPRDGSQWELSHFPSFMDFVSSEPIGERPDLTLWLRTGHTLTSQDLESCIQAHQASGATATAFPSDIVIPDEWKSLLQNLTPEALVGWENPAFSCFAAGKFACPVAPLIISTSWLDQFSSRMKKGPQIGGPATLSSSDYVAALMGKDFRRNKEKLKLVISPRLKLDLSDDLNPSLDPRRRALVRSLCFKAADLGSSKHRGQQGLVGLIKKRLSGKSKTASPESGFSSELENLLIDGISEGGVLSGKKDKPHSEIAAVERFVKSLDDAVLINIQNYIRSTRLEAISVWRAQIQI